MIRCGAISEIVLARPIPIRNLTGTSAQVMVGSPAEDFSIADGMAVGGKSYEQPRTILEVAENYIFDHLDRRDLDAAMLMRQLGLSRTTLYRSFAVRGGVTAAIRNARLDRVRDQLSSPSYRAKTIEDLAIGAGFSDYISFYRSFRRRFGAPPRAIRGRD